MSYGMFFWPSWKDHAGFVILIIWLLLLPPTGFDCLRSTPQERPDNLFLPLSLALFLSLSPYPSVYPPSLPLFPPPPPPPPPLSSSSSSLFLSPPPAPPLSSSSS